MSGVDSRHDVLGQSELKSRERQIPPGELELPVSQRSLYGGLVDDPATVQAVKVSLDDFAILRQLDVEGGFGTLTSRDDPPCPVARHVDRLDFGRVGRERGLDGLLGLVLRHLLLCRRGSDEDGERKNNDRYDREKRFHGHLLLC